MENQQKIERKRRAEARTLKQGNNHLKVNRWNKKRIRPGYSGT